MVTYKIVDIFNYGKFLFIWKTVSAIIQQYELGTSANVLKIKKALVQKELIDDTGATIEFLDPAYERWFQKNMKN